MRAKQETLLVDLGKPYNPWARGEDAEVYWHMLNARTRREPLEPKIGEIGRQVLDNEGVRHVFATLGLGLDPRAAVNFVVPELFLVSNSSMPDYPKSPFWAAYTFQFGGEKGEIDGQEVFRYKGVRARASDAGEKALDFTINGRWEQFGKHVDRHLKAEWEDYVKSLGKPERELSFKEVAQFAVQHAS